MNTNEIIFHLPNDAIYMFLGGGAQFLLVLYCLGHPSRSGEKWALIRWLLVWLSVSFIQGMWKVDLATNAIPVGVGNSRELLWHQLGFVVFCWIGITGIDFFFRFLKRKETMLLRITLVLTILTFITSLVYQPLTYRGSTQFILVQIPIVVLPFFYALGRFIHKFFTSKVKLIRIRTGIFMISMCIGMFLYVGLIILGINVLKVIPAEYRSLISMINSLQVAVLFTIAITKYGALEIGIEEAAEEMFSHMDDPVFILTEDGTITRANPAATLVFKIKEITGTELITDWIKNYTPEHQRFESCVQLNKEDTIFFCTQTKIRRDGEPVGNVLVMRDITEERIVSNMKNSFMSTVSHELRTPLTSILGFTKIIKKKLEQVILPKFTPESKKQERAQRQVLKNIDVIVSEGERLTALINNVLDITKMESGTIKWNFKETTIKQILEQAIAATQGIFGAKNIDFVTKINVSELKIVVDKDRLIQVLVNLISNAVKFTEEGEIKLVAEERSEDIVISVKDSGIGMRSEDVSTVFEKYKQVGESPQSGQKGTGLGLPISKEIIDGHGGEIWAESELGVGSTFFFTIPVSKASAPTIQTLQEKEILLQLKSLEHLPVSGTKKKILIVDDEPSIRQLVRQSLEPVGYKIDEAPDGLSALESIRLSQPELIILDVMMPKMNGFDLAAIVKNDLGLMHIPIMMLTVIPDEQRGYGLGVDVYLQKPISPEEIRTEVSALFAKLSDEKLILLAGKRAEIQSLAQQLKSMRYTVLQASSTEQFSHHKGKRLTMVVVEADFAKPAELQMALNTIGQSTTLIRLLQPNH